MTEDWIAERSLMVEHPKKGRLEVTIRIGRPIRDPGLDRWSCSVYLEGLERKSWGIRGFDALQALDLAMTFARRCLLDYEEEGAVFYWLNGQHLKADGIFSERSAKSVTLGTGE